MVQAVAGSSPVAHLLTTTDADTIGGRVAAGREALSRGAWADARESFEAALRAEETGEACEGLGWAGYWLHDAELTLGSRQRAYQAYRGRGDLRGAPTTS